jgi:endonuclease III-like uncharacterized protein
MSEIEHDAIRAYYQALFLAWGRQHWWPAQSCFEVIIGAYLTQNTSWTNVEKALGNLRRARLLSVAGIRRTPLHQLEQLIRPSGYFRQKAQRLKTFVGFLDARYGGSLQRMFARPTAELREELLALAEWSWARDRRLHSSLCRQSCGVCRGRLHSARSGAAWDYFERRGL